MTIDSVTVNLDQGAPGPQHHWAMSMGADCARCPLRNLGRGPVPPSIPNDMDVLVVAEAPGHTEIDQGTTLCGASGKLVRRTLQEAGAPMSKVGYSNAMYCAPPGTLKDFLRANKKKGNLSPIDCCRGHLNYELSRAKYVILMGSASLTAVGLDSSVLTVRGTPLVIPRWNLPAIAIPHAAFVMRDEGRIMAPIFTADVKKGVRIAYTGSTWRDPRYFVPRDAAEVTNFLASRTDTQSIDVETDGIDPWTCNLRRVGIGNASEVMIYSPLSVRGHKLISADNEQAQSRAIADFVQRQTSYYLHNGIGYDSIVLHRFGMPLQDARIFDTMIAHQIGNTSELPHGLDFLGSVYTDAPYWKDDVKHSNVKDDAVLDRYLSYDIAVTAQSAPYVAHNLQVGQQQHVYAIDHEMFVTGRSMSALGIYIDAQKRLEFAVEYQKKSIRLRQEFVETAGRDINPGSPVQIRQLLYRDLGLPALEEHYTASGDPSTDENTLLDLLALGVPAQAEKIIHALLGYREAEKILGTYLGHIVDGRLEGGLPVHADGRMRVAWRPGKRTGRWGSSPNAQNIVNKLREMFKPAPGNVFVAADAQAQELRMVALLAGDQPLIEAFQLFDAGKGPDVHTFNACTVFKCAPEAVTKKVRDMIKRFVYALAYGAQPPKIHQTLSLLRDDNLQPMFPGITLQEVERLFNTWWKLHPAQVEWAKKLIYNWRSTGYVATQWHKRKRYFIGGEKREEMVNYPVQASSADMQNTAIAELVRAYPFDYVNRRGLVLNVHDQLVVECAESEAEDVKRLVQRVMAKQVGPMKFPAEAKSGFDWKSV